MCSVLPYNVTSERLSARCWYQNCDALITKIQSVTLSESVHVDKFWPLALQTSGWTWQIPCSEDSTEGSRNMTVSYCFTLIFTVGLFTLCFSESHVFLTDDFNEIIARALKVGVEKVCCVHHFDEASCILIIAMNSGIAAVLICFKKGNREIVGW